MSDAKKKSNVTIKKTNVRIEWFAVITERPDEFIDRLQLLCKQYCSQGDYFFDYRFEE